MSRTLSAFPIHRPTILTCAAASALSVTFPASADVTATVNGLQNVKPISPLIYGTNQSSIPSTSDRLGGNRWTAYNWENNASNAGADYYFQNDNHLVSGASATNQNRPGYAVLPALQTAAANNRATVLTVPIAGYVSADKNGGGDVRYNNNTYNPSNNGWINGTPNPNYLSQRFKVLKPAKGAPFTLTPNTTDAEVYADEFVNWVNANKTANQQVLYNLDNEPDLWSHTHAEIHPAKTTYAELVQRNIDYATAIKNVAPNAVVMGAVNYGWNGYRTLQDAPDRAGRDFQTYYLQQMRLADQAAGRRLVDVLDFHWYPEAQGNGVRITGSDTSAAVAAARIQAPRSLWDPTYVETSWITQFSTGNQPIRLLPRTQGLVDAHNPGMKMAITEYNYGAGNHISGGIAHADALGIFGEQGLYAANWWDLGVGSRFVSAAARMFLNYNGQGAQFGDTSVASTVSSDATASVYASLDSEDPARLTLILINKTSTNQPTTISLQNLKHYATAQAWQFNSTSAVVNGVVQISALPAFNLADPNSLTFTMSPLSVTTLLLLPRAGDANADGTISPDDYALVDRGFAHSLTGFSNGDFNGNGSVDASDYLALDTAYAQQQGGLLSPDLLALRTAQFGADYVSQLLASVPEPTLSACLFAGCLVPRPRRR